MCLLNVDGSNCLCTRTVCVWFACAPSNSCSRTIDDEILARPVKETDLLLLGLAHPVPRGDCFRRWQSMAWRVSNSLVQWAHLNPTAWGRLCCTAGRITHGTRSSLQGPGIFLARWPPDNAGKIRAAKFKYKRQTKFLFCPSHGRGCITCQPVLGSWQMWESATT